ncbi:MAG: DUF4390 domain-containing protein [Candidatus Krumholzibacteriia bacterium]
MRTSWRRPFGILLGLCVGTTASTRATELRIEQVAATSQGFLYVEFELQEPFEGIYLEALQSGLPTTLDYTIEVWRDRSGWWDKLEDTYEREFRLFRDLLNDEYLVVTPEETQQFAALDSLVEAVCLFHRHSEQGPQYFRRALFAPGKRYYVVITAHLAPLSVEDLNELDDWLQGTIRRRGDQTRGGISALSRTMGGLLMSMTGFGDKKVRGRTPKFRPEEVLEQPIRIQVERDDIEPVLAIPDSGDSR